MISHSAEETIEFAEKIGSLLRCGDIVAYRGGMGAGKTTFTRGLAKGLGLEDEVISPTFSIVNEYRGKVTLYHFDMYRIENENDLETTGFYDYPLEESIFVIEWSENIKKFIADSVVVIEMEYISENERKISVKGDERFADFGD